MGLIGALFFLPYHLNTNIIQALERYAILLSRSLTWQNAADSPALASSHLYSHTFSLTWRCGGDTHYATIETTSRICTMTLDLPNAGSASRSVLGLFCNEAVFLGLFTFLVLGTAAFSTSKRIGGLGILCATTIWMESLVVPVCLRNERPHWAATVASLLWVQFLSASDLILVRRVHAAQFPHLHLHGASPGIFRGVKTAVGLLWNIRRVNTPWQVKNVPSSGGLQTQSRAGFILRRVIVTVLAYIFVDAVVSMPPPEQNMVRADKAALFSLRSLTPADLAFRSGTVLGYWLTTGILNLFMNNVGAVAAVLLGLSSPADCPPLYGSFSEAYTIRRFWG